MSQRTSARSASPPSISVTELEPSIRRMLGTACRLTSSDVHSGEAAGRSAFSLRFRSDGVVVSGGDAGGCTSVGGDGGG